jgi:hypothetical protein
VRRNEIYPLLSQSSITIWQELGYENKSLIDDPDDLNPNTLLRTSNCLKDGNIDDEYCENIINKFKTLLNEV